MRITFYFVSKIAASKPTSAATKRCLFRILEMSLTVSDSATIFRIFPSHHSKHHTFSVCTMSLHINLMESSFFSLQLNLLFVERKKKDLRSCVEFSVSINSIVSRIIQVMHSAARMINYHDPFFC